MSTTEKAGSCLVCGAPSTLRCSSCAAKSDLDLFFCSKEHQRLAWPGHRLVCGDRAHPFRLPPYSQEEADALRAALCSPPSGSGQVQYQQLIRDVLGAKGSSVEEMVSTSHQLIGQGGLARPRVTAAQLVHEPDPLVFEYRKMCSLAKQYAPFCKDSPQPFSAIDTFVKHYDSATENCANISTDRWHSEFCHRLMAAVPLAHACLRKASLEFCASELFSPSGAQQCTVVLAEEGQMWATAYSGLQAFLRDADTPERIRFAEAVLHDYVPRI